MDSNKLFTLTNLLAYLKMSLLLFVLFSAVYFIFKNAFPYFAYDEAYFGRHWEVKWSLIGHMSGGILALVIGPVQFWKSFRDKYIKTHRMLGKIYLVAILVGTVSAIHMALTTGLAIHWTWALALLGLAFAWIITAGMAYISIRRKRIVEHQKWMIKSYVVTFAFVTFRFLDDLPLVEGLGSFIETGPSNIWLSWTIPLMITEVVMSLKNK